MNTQQLNKRLDEQLAAIENEIWPLLIEEAKRLVQRWKPATGFVFAMGREFFTTTLSYPAEKVSTDTGRNERDFHYGKIPKYIHEFLDLVQKYGEQFGYNPFRVNKDGDVTYNW